MIRTKIGQQRAASKKLLEDDTERAVKAYAAELLAYVSNAECHAHAKVLAQRADDIALKVLEALRGHWSIRRRGK